MKSRFTVTVALATLLASSTIPTLTYATESTKVVSSSKEDTTDETQTDSTNEVNSTNEEDSFTSTQNARTAISTNIKDTTSDTTSDTKKVNKNRDSEKSSKKDTNNSKSRTVSTQSRTAASENSTYNNQSERLSTEKEEATNKINQLNGLNEYRKNDFSQEINDAKSQEEIDDIVRKAKSENNTNYLINARDSASNSIEHNYKYLNNSEKERYLSKISDAHHASEVYEIRDQAKQLSHEHYMTQKKASLKTAKKSAINSVQNNYDYLSTTEKNKYVNRINKATTTKDAYRVRDEAKQVSYNHYIAQKKASLQSAKESAINSVQNNYGHLSASSKNKYINRINKATTAKDAYRVRDEARRYNDVLKARQLRAQKSTYRKVQSKQVKRSTTNHQTMSKSAIQKLDEELGFSTANTDESPIKISPNMTGKEFVEAIADYASEIAEKNDLYASVMIAQACLESGFGTSGLASSPYYNLFGIKGSYKGKSVNMRTLEDGSNGMYAINAGFRDYPSPKESLEDYAKLLDQSFYSGAHKSKTNSYEDATKFLTGRYATDRNYARKLNGIIEAYNLTQYDNGGKKTPVKRIKKITKYYYIVKKGDTLESIALAHEHSIDTIEKWNEKVLKGSTEAKPGQKLLVDKKISYSYEEIKEDKDKQPAKQGQFNLPLKAGSYTVTSPFGGRRAPNAAAGTYHEGIDLAVPMNSKVYAARDGVIFAKGYDPSAGNYVFIYHGNGLFSNYFHLSSSSVKVGQHVDAGQVIARSGSTGNSTGPHLHFGISHRLWGDYENPENYIDFR